MMQNITFLIYSPVFQERSGGTIAMHALCHHLNKNGYNSYIYFKPRVFKTILELFLSFLPFLKVSGKYFLDINYLKIKLQYALGFSFYRTLEIFDAPKYSGEIDENFIVVYPEIVEGNPLNAKNVVRWLLHKPGYHTGKINYGENELYFYYQQFFNDKSLNPDEDNLLRLVLIRKDIFYNKGLPNRKGTCYAVRKSKRTDFQHDVTGSILIDNLSLEQVAEVFNKCEYFYSYDTKTSYSRYAVLCGCKSIVVPEKGVTKEEWQPEEYLRYGIAYGIEDMEYAEKTKHLAIENMNRMEEENDLMVKNFVQKCRSFFHL